MRRKSRNPNHKDPAKWRCPACREATLSPRGLAAHLRGAHVPCDRRERKGTRWACPHRGCVWEERPTYGPLSLASHLDLHVTGVAPLGKPGTHRGWGRVTKFLERTPRRKLLRLDWRLRNKVLARHLRLSPDHVGEVRNRLREEGHDIPDSLTILDLLLATRRKEVLSLDWTKYDVAIAKKLGVSDTDIRHLRLRLRAEGRDIPTQGPRGVIERYLAAHPLKEVVSLDWTRPNSHLAPEMGFSLAEVVALRLHLRRRGVRLPRPKRRPYKYTPEKLKAFQRAGLGRHHDKVVARRLGVPPYFVRGMRSRYGVRLTPAARRERTEMARRARREHWLARLRPYENQGLSFREIAAKVGLDPTSVRHLAREYGLRLGARKVRVDWKGVDWTKTNTEISLATGIRAVRLQGRRLALRAAGHDVPIVPPPSSWARRLMWKAWDRRMRPVAAKVRRLAGKTVSAHEISDRLGIPHTLVDLIFERFHLPHRPMTLAPGSAKRGTGKKQRRVPRIR